MIIRFETKYRVFEADFSKMELYSYSSDMFAPLVPEKHLMWRAEMPMGPVLFVEKCVTNFGPTYVLWQQAHESKLYMGEAVVSTIRKRNARR